MSEALRTKAGPWCGAVTDSSATVKASLLKSVTSARLLVAENEQMTDGRVDFEARSIVSFPEGKYKQKIASFRAEGLKASTRYFYELELDGERGDALPGRFQT